MFKFKRRKPFVLSQTNAVPLNAVDRVLSIYYKLCVAPLFNRGEVVRKDVTIVVEPFSSVVDAEGGKVHLALLEGHYEADGIGHRVSHPFSASVCVRLYENGSKSPSIAYEGCHDVTVDGEKLMVVFEAPDRFKFARMTGHDVRGRWYHSNEALRLDQLPESQTVHARLYAARIRTLGHLKNWTRPELLEVTQDIAAVIGAEKILAAYGYKFKGE